MTPEESMKTLEQQINEAVATENEKIKARNEARTEPPPLALNRPKAAVSADPANLIIEAMVMQAINARAAQVRNTVSIGPRDLYVRNQVMGWLMSITQGNAHGDP